MNFKNRLNKRKITVLERILQEKEEELKSYKKVVEKLSNGNYVKLLNQLTKARNEYYDLCSVLEQRDKEYAEVIKTQKLISKKYEKALKGMR